MALALSYKEIKSSRVTEPIATLLVADGLCPKIRKLLSNATVPVLWLNGVQEPLTTISDQLLERREQGQPVQTLHWVCHGSPGVLRIGDKKVDRAALLAASNQLIDWRLDQLALWACDYGADHSALSLWEELLGASIYSSDGILGLDADGQQNWTLHSQKRSNQIDWPMEFGQNKSWHYQLATVSYATFSEGPQASDPLTSSEQITAVGYTSSRYDNVITGFVSDTLDAITNLDYTNNIDDLSFLDSEIEADLVYIVFPESVPTTSQLDNLKQFVEGGGTLLISGEWSTAFDEINSNASAILNYIGSSIAVKEGTGMINDSTLNATPPDGTTDIVEIGNYDITSGLSTVKTGSFGALEIDDQTAEAILVTSENATNNIVMAREAVGSGNAIVFADVNMFDADNNNLFSNIIIQSKINIEEANSSPVISSAGGTLAFTEGDGATVIDSSITITDDDDTNIESATITISSGYQSAEDVLAFSDTSAITGSWNTSTGVLTLTGSDTLANYETALESVTYNNTSDNPNTANRIVSWAVNDGTDSSSAITSTINITAVNDAPVTGETSKGENSKKIQSIYKARTQKKTTTFELIESAKVNNKNISTIIIGTENKDEITGTLSGEIIASMSGRDNIRGGGGADGFLFQDRNHFGKKEQDTIVDFNPERGDSLLIDGDIFDLGSNHRLKKVKNMKKAKRKDNSKADFIYEEKRGYLWYNENGKEDGWGDGGVFVKLKGAPELGLSDFTIV